MHGTLKRKQSKKLTETELKLNLACGKTRLDGCVNVDIIRREAVDKVCDLTSAPWPWKSNSVAEIFCTYFFNYLDGYERNKLMDECWRVLKPEGTLQIKVPHWSSMRSTCDPFYKWPPISEVSFMVYNKEWRERNEQDHYPIKCDFDYSYGYGLDPALNTRSDDYKQTAVKHYNNAVLDLLVTLKKR